MIDTNGLLMIEPLGPATEPVNDDLTALARMAWDEARAKVYDDTGEEVRYRGSHACVCGKTSDNRDWSVRGMPTNSLLVHYVACHRADVPQTEIDKLESFRVCASAPLTSTKEMR